MDGLGETPPPIHHQEFRKNTSESVKQPTTIFPLAEGHAQHFCAKRIIDIRNPNKRNTNQPSDKMARVRFQGNAIRSACRKPKESDKAKGSTADGV